MAVDPPQPLHTGHGVVFRFDASVTELRGAEGVVHEVVTSHPAPPRHPLSMILKPPRVSWVPSRGVLSHRLQMSWLDHPQQKNVVNGPTTTNAFGDGRSSSHIYPRSH